MYTKTSEISHSSAGWKAKVKVNLVPWPNFVNVCISPPQNSDTEIQTPEVMALGRGAFGRWLGHNGGALWVGLVPL
jgi:hypothetical protein